MTDAQTAPTAPRVSVIRRIFQAIARTFAFLRVSIANILVVFFLILVFALIFAGPEPTSVKDNSILVLAPGQRLVEEASIQDPISGLLLAQAGVRETKVHDIVRAVRHAAEDPKIRALEIRPQNLLFANSVQLESISTALREFEVTGKPISLTATTTPKRSTTWRAMRTRSICILREILSSGVSLSNAIFQSLLDFLKINVHTFRAGEFKSAIEPFTRNSMSEEVKASYRTITDQLWNSYAERVAANRNLGIMELQDYAQNLATIVVKTNNDFAKIATDHGLIDHVATKKEYGEFLKKDSGGKDLNDVRIQLESYVSTLPQQASHSDVVGIITVSGGIFDIPMSFGGQKQNSTVQNIRNALKANVRALVLRVDSPGGSVVASENIREELDSVRRRGIPIVVSMAGTAASGAYWISAQADKILASKSTITGSIGVFALLPTVEDSLGSIGVTSGGVRSPSEAITLDPLTGLSESEQIVLQARVKQSYKRFLNIVQNGREMKIQDLEPIAGGRIWTGSQALERGLIDEIGGRDEAVRAAVELADLSNYKIKEFRSEPAGLSSLFANLGIELPTLGMETNDWLNHARSAIEELRVLFQPRTIYALCDSCISSVSR